jgi:hypothetical protein
VPARAPPDQSSDLGSCSLGQLSPLKPKNAESYHIMMESTEQAQSDISLGLQPQLGCCSIWARCCRWLQWRWNEVRDNQSINQSMLHL